MSNPSRKIGFDRASLEDKVLSEDEESIVFSAIIAREMVQPYPDGMAFKPADELEKAAWTAEGRWLTTEKHPDTQLLIRREDVKGRVESPRFVKDLLDPKTRRPMDKGIRASLRFFKNMISPQLLDDMKNGQRRDVSIGFLYDEDKSPGEWRGQRYDFVQRNIFIDHVAAAVPVGRCPSPYCGIGIDQLGRKLGLDPYKSIEDLPKQVKVLPEEAQRMFLEVVNSALEQYRDEEKAFATAWAAVKEKWEKVDDKWVKKEEKDEVSGKVDEKDCPICKEIDRLGKLEFSMRLVRGFGKDAVLKTVRDQEEWEREKGGCSEEEWSKMTEKVKATMKKHGHEVEEAKEEEKKAGDINITSLIADAEKALLLHAKLKEIKS